jgi:hypothetical protein
MGVVTFDIEIEKMVEDLPGGWEDAKRGLAGVASGVAYDSASGRYHLYDGHTLDSLGDHLEDADLVVSFNGRGFDVPALSGVLGRRLHLPRHYDLLKEIWDVAGRFYKGWKLHDVCMRTLGVGKTGHGEHAPVLAQQGRWAELFDYNLHDVWLTRELYNHVLKHGFVVDPDGEALELEAPEEYGQA